MQKLQGKTIRSSFSTLQEKIEKQQKKEKMF